MSLNVILRSVLSNWTGYFIATIVVFFLSPFTVHRLGDTAYGVWTLIISLTGYFGILDFGIRSTVGRYVARYIALNDPDNVNRSVSSAFAMLAGSGLLAACGAAILTLVLDRFQVDSALQRDARIALLIGGVNVALSMPLGVFSGVLVALDRFDILNGVNVAGWLIRAALIVFFLNAGKGLIAMALITVSVAFAEYAAMWICARRLYPALRVAPRWVTFAGCKELLTFSVYRLIWILASQLIYYTDSVVIGLWLNAAAITYFTIAASLITYGRNIVMRLTDAFGPSATRLDAHGDAAGMQRLLVTGTKTSLLVGLPLCVGYLFLGGQFIELWMGSSYSTSAMLLAALTVAQLFGISQYIATTILTAMARHQILAWLALGSGVANVLLSIVLVQRFGLMGVAWGTVIPEIICTGIIVPAFTLSVVRVPIGTYLVEGYLKPLIAAAPAAVLAWLLASAVRTPSWMLFVMEVAAVCAAFAVTSALVCFSSAQRTAVLQKIRTVLHPEAVADEA
jgi:O-antigen/teichoic acid export membrane protein